MPRRRGDKDGFHHLARINMDWWCFLQMDVEIGAMVAQVLSGADDGAPIAQLVGAQVEAYLLSEFAHGRSARRLTGMATAPGQRIPPAIPVANQQKPVPVPYGHQGPLALGPEHEPEAAAEQVGEPVKVLPESVNTFRGRGAKWW